MFVEVGEGDIQREGGGAGKAAAAGTKHAAQHVIYCASGCWGANNVRVAGQRRARQRQRRRR